MEGGDSHLGSFLDVEMAQLGKSMPSVEKNF